MTFDMLYLFRGLVYVFCAEHCTYVFNSCTVHRTDIHVRYVFAIASAGFLFCWLVSPFRERNNFIWLI